MRMLCYSPDSYGLGHVRRSISVIEAVLGRVRDGSALVLTGAPRAHYFDYPERCDYVKLPSITKNARGHYVSRDLDLHLEQLVELRGQLIDVAVQSFRPRLLLVDHSPLGLCGEVLPALRKLAQGPRGAVRVLGMRDVIDEPAAVRAAWERDGVIDVLRRGYDRILVYGQRDLFDPIREYGIPDDVARKITFVGYVPRNGRRADPAELKRRFAPRTGRLVVVTLGGGGDGNLVLRSFLEGYERLGAMPPFEVLAVTGPLMSPRKREHFKSWSRRLPGVSLVEYFADLPDMLESADFVVSMGGYNTVCELACAGARALIVPRSSPRKEQLLRARLLAERGVVDYLPDREPEPALLMNRVLGGLEQPRPTRGWGLSFSGLDNAAGILARLVGGAAEDSAEVSALAR